MSAVIDWMFIIFFGTLLCIMVLILLALLCAAFECLFCSSPSKTTSNPVSTDKLSPTGKNIVDALTNPGKYPWEVRDEYGIRHLVRKVENYETLLEPSNGYVYVRIDHNPRVKVALVGDDYNAVWTEGKKINEEFKTNERLVREAAEKRVIDAVLEASKAKGS